MTEKQSNKNCYRVFKSFYKLGKKGRGVHVVATTVACLTIAVTAMAGEYTLNTALPGPVTIAAKEFALTVTDKGSITHTTGASKAQGISIEARHNITVTNSGKISANSTNAQAYAIDTNSLWQTTGKFVNAGTISASASAGTAIAFKLSCLESTEVTNTGVMDVSGATAAGILGQGMWDASHMENTATGRIRVTSTTGSARGMSNGISGGIMLDTSAMVNAGRIEVKSTANGNVVGMETMTAYNASLENSGTILAENTSGNLTGIWLKASSENATLTNSGKIILIQNGGLLAFGIRAQKAASTTSIKNSGTITLTSTATDGHAFGVNIEGATTFFGGDIIETATFTNTGTIEAVNGSGNMADNLFSVNTSGAVTNSGTLKGKLKAGDTTNSGRIIIPDVTSTITGNFIQAGSGTLGISLFSDDNPANNKFSKVSVSGTTTLADGSGIDVDVTTATNRQPLLIGQTLTGVIKSAGGIMADTAALNVTDNSILLKFSPRLGSANTSLDLRVEKEMSIFEATVEGGGTGVTGAAGSLDKLMKADSSDPQISVFINNLLTLETESGVAKRVQQAAPVAATQAPTMATQIANTMSSVVQARQQSVRGFSSGDSMFSDRNFWFKPFASRMDQDDVNGVSGFSANALGLGIGADGEYGPNQRLGLAFFYTDASTSANNTPQNSELDVFNLMVYGSRPIINEAHNLFYQIGGGLQATESRRYIQALASTAKADYTAKNLFAQVKATKTFELDSDTRIMAGPVLSYAWFSNPSYQETEAGGMNLNVEGFDSHSLVAAMEGDLIWCFDKNIELMLSAALGYDIINDKTSVGSSFQGGGPVFRTQGIDNSPVVYSAGIGIARKFTNRFSLDTKYDLEGRGSDVMTHMVSAKFNWKF